MLTYKWGRGAAPRVIYLVNELDIFTRCKAQWGGTKSTKIARMSEAHQSNFER